MTMSEECDCLKHCGFFCKFGGRESNLWRGLVSFYCKGRGFSLCERRKRYLTHPAQLSDDMMPTGLEASKAFLSLL